MSNSVIGKIDKNLEVKTSINESDIRFYDSRWEPFEIYGLYDPKNQPVFKRLPDEIGLHVNDGVSYLYRDTAGGRVRFSTDSSYVAINASNLSISRVSHMPLTCSGGFDLYEDRTDGTVSRYRGTFIPPYNVADSYESIIYLGSKKMRYFTINFPTYGHVGNLYIGLEKDAKVGGGAKYANDRPTVYYGSSITQGGCASRPGNTYQNFVSRWLNLDYVNLGFSGSCRGEDSIVGYMAHMDMSVFISDYDHNAPDPEHLEATHLKMYRKIREVNPDLPMILISRPDFDVNYDDSVICRNIIFDTYRYARDHGDRKIYYIDGEGFFRGEFEDACTVDKCHPNDLGFALMAKGITAMLQRIMIEHEI